ncbi:hypothetical protein CYY_003372 [Polysphondylium violaceum]|uniref:3-oxo-5-alpha-steroid 4-dehydrogenase C-terminal domain-containing protein n=1 Tax=Polysphondylium violaceum TaxID=133409 RepID=A0A8J4V1B7_9MYCE|nr:hypothetical protein CYY_003372 [Polysphondylium violaceum]
MITLFSNNEYISLYLYYLSIFYWILGITIYLLKVFNKDFNHFTSYGKLSNQNKSTSSSSSSKTTTATRNDNNDKPFSIVNFLSLFYLDRCFIVTEFTLNKTILIIYLLFIIQGSRRFLETYFIQKHVYSRMNNLLFLSGLSYYLFLVLSLYFEYSVKSSTTTSSLIPITVGIILFTFASFKQYQCHVILSSLRKDNNDNKHSIPYGEWFNLVSSPHYFSELLIYFSYLLITQFQYKSLILCFLFTSINLIHRSMDIHQWYMGQFKYYPKNRKSIIPFIL